MRILITNVYSYKNKGDAAIVLSLVHEVRRVFKDAEILIQTADIKHDQGKYEASITSSLLWLLLSSVRTKSLFTRLLVSISGIVGLFVFLLVYKYTGLQPRFLLSKPLQQFVKENQEADIVIACGGGYLRSGRNNLYDTVLLITTCLNFLTAFYIGRKVYLYSQSIGPVHGRLQNGILRFALNRVALIEPREDVSLKLLKQLRLRTKIVETADPALLLGSDGIFPKQIKLTPKRLHVGLTVRKWFEEPEKLETYIQAVAETIDYLIITHNAEVLYAPQVIAQDFGDDDRIIARKVREHVKNREYFKVIEADLHPFEVIGLCGKMDIFMGTRMHSNIFALINYVPVVAIEYEHKTKGIMRGLGLEPLTIDIQLVTPKSLRQKVDLLLEKREHYRNLIKQNLPKQIEKSRKAIEAIRQSYEADNTR